METRYALNDHGLENGVVELTVEVIEQGVFRWVAIAAAECGPSNGLWMDIDGNHDRSPLTEAPGDPSDAYQWFIEDPTGRGVLAESVPDSKQ